MSTQDYESIHILVNSSGRLSDHELSISDVMVQLILCTVCSREEG